MKLIKLTQLNTDPMVIPNTYHIPVEKIDYVIEHETGSTVVVNRADLRVIEPAEYINSILSANTDFSNFGGFNEYVD